MYYSKHAYNLYLLPDSILFWTWPDTKWLHFSSEDHQAVVAASAAGPINGSEKTKVKISDCQLEATAGNWTSFMSRGFDISRADPLHISQALAKRLFSGSSSGVENCPVLTSATDNNELGQDQVAAPCRLEASSDFIDSIDAYQQWVANSVAVEAADRSLLAVTDAQYTRTLHELTAGSDLVLTRIQCARYELWRPGRPASAIPVGLAQTTAEVSQLSLLDSQFARQSATGYYDADDENGACELVEDYGSHFVTGLVIGHQLIVRFVLNNYTADRHDIVRKANAAALLLLHGVGVGTPFDDHLAGADFLASLVSDMKIYPETAHKLPPMPQDGDSSRDGIRQAFATPSVLRVYLRRIDSLFPADGAGNNWRRWRSDWQLCADPLLGGADDDETFVLPLIGIDSSSARVQVPSRRHCLDLCRADRLCTAVTYRSGTGVPDCALHRDSQLKAFLSQGDAVTWVIKRPDLRPVQLKGLTLDGPARARPGLRGADLASCLRLCVQTAGCAVISFVHDPVQGKSCAFFSSVSGNQLRLRDNVTASIVFVMAALGQCFEAESGLRNNICPDGAQCWNGLCLCQYGFSLSNNGSCVAWTSSATYEQPVHPGAEKETFIASTELSVATITSSTTESTSSEARVAVTTATVNSSDTVAEAAPTRLRPTVDGYHIRGVFVPATKAVTQQAITITSTPTTSTTVAPGALPSAQVKTTYKPWQLRSRTKTPN